MAQTYRRPHTVTRGGTTFNRRGGPVRYQPASRGAEGVLAGLRVVAVGISRPVMSVVHKVTDLPGRKARLERDKALVALMSERHALRTKLSAVDDEDERLRLRRRIWELDQIWRSQNPGASMQPLPQDVGLDILDSSAETTKGPEMPFMRPEAVRDLRRDVESAYLAAREDGELRVADRYGDWLGQLDRVLEGAVGSESDIQIYGDMIDAAEEFGYTGI